MDRIRDRHAVVPGPVRRRPSRISRVRNPQTGTWASRSAAISRSPRVLGRPRAALEKQAVRGSALVGAHQLAGREHVALDRGLQLLLRGRRL